MVENLHLSEITLGLGSENRVTVPVNEIVKVEVDLVSHKVIALYSNGCTIEISEEQAAKLIHYNAQWRDL